MAPRKSRSSGAYAGSKLKVFIPPKKWKTNSATWMHCSRVKQAPSKGQATDYIPEEKES